MTTCPISDDYGRAATHWPIGAVHGVREVAGGAVNDVAEIVSDTGRYFLRRYRSGSSALIEREHRVIAHVRNGGLPVIEPVTASNGSTFVEVHGRFHALYPAASGEQREAGGLDLPAAIAAGSMLGRLHGVLASFPRDGLSAPRIAWDRDAWIGRLRSVEAAILATGEANEEDAIALERVQDQRAWLADPVCPHSDTPLDRQPVHGDYHHGNLFFGPAGVTGIIDWEQAALMPRAYEAVRAATYMFDLASAPTQAFLKAWKEAAGATDDELDAGARTFGVVRDHWVWAVEEVYLSSNERARRYIPTTPFQPFASQWSSFREKGKE